MLLTVNRVKSLKISQDWITGKYMITISTSAQSYLLELLEKQNKDVVGIRIFITQPGTPHAETCIAYCRKEDVQEMDELMKMDTLQIHLDARSLPFLDDAQIDYSADRMGGQLTIKAPNSKMPRVGDDSSIEDKVNYVLYNEINPSLASHGGDVSLVEITDKKVAILRFGGGCQGCSAVDMTLKHGVEKTLMEQIPELTAVRDVTDHTDTSSAYM